MDTEENQTDKGNGSTPPNPFANIESLRRAQDYDEFTNPEPTTSFSVRTMQEGMHLRVNSDPMYSLLGVYTLETKSSGVYFVWPQFRDALGPLPRRCNLHVAVNGHGEYFMLRVKLSNPGQDDNRWYTTARMVAAQAMQEWVKVTKPQNIDGGWGYITIQHQMFDPQWPQKPLEELLARAFPDRVVDRLSHELIEEYNKRGR
jgi:hypothetical protein